MGVQSTDEEVLRLNKRGHTLETVRQAIHLMRQYGFKISLHVMPGLYGSSREKDLQTFRDLFSDPFFKPDELKIYPTSVIPGTELFHLYQEGKYSPITTEEILSLIKEIFQTIIPPYTRIKRLIRDIPAPEIVAGSSITNLSQLAHENLLREYALRGKGSEGNLVAPEVQKFYARLYESDDLIETTIIGEKPDLVSYRQFVSLDTRSREVRNRGISSDRGKPKKGLCLVIRKYASSVGTEFFISYEDELGYLYGFTRLLLPLPEHTVDYPGLGKGTALIRELHVYGELQKLGETSGSATQHT
jgi:elongator complex protein 3